jgi:hypothetical protein
MAPRIRDFNAVRAARFVGLMLSLALWSGGCSPIEAVFHCKLAADCPAGFVCSQGEARCVRPEDQASAADAAVACGADTDCTSAGPCDPVHCAMGACIHAPIGAGVALPDAEQFAGDCHVSTCDGHGALSMRADDLDAPGDDGNACHKHACAGGMPDVSAVADGQPCNATGVCKDGQCSVCADGVVCTSASACTIHLTQCGDANSQQCVDTGMPIEEHKVCGTGRVCSAGACTDCVVGAECEGSTPCRVRRVTSCTLGKVCDVQEPAGGSCGSDSSGNPMTCNAGECGYPCQQGTCAATTDPCQTSHWNCAEPKVQPTCVTVPVDDGTACGSDQACHAGACAHSVLVNSQFAHGLTGWTLTGEATKFPVLQDSDPDNRRLYLTTWVADEPGGGDLATGSVSQQFVVPEDALALRFTVFGGHAEVRLQDASGAKLEGVTGPDRNDIRVPVSWDLTARHGQTVTLIIQDSITQMNWNFVGVTGFDVIRANASPIKNAQYDSDLTQGWQLTDDAPYWSVFDDYNFGGMGGVDGIGDSAFGRRRGISSYVRSSQTAHTGVAATGSVSQTFVVPPDATALRFNVYGGDTGRVTLFDGKTQVEHTSGKNSNAIKTPVSWDLTTRRGSTLTLTVSDNQTSGDWGYVGCSGFDLITGYNGP